MYLHVDTSGDAMITKKLRVELMVSKWGNSLAVRSPAELAKKIGVGEGDTLIAEVSPDGRLVLAPEGRAIGKAESRRLRQFLERQKETAPVVGDMRRGAYPRPQALSPSDAQGIDAGGATRPCRSHGLPAQEPGARRERPPQ